MAAVGRELGFGALADPVGWMERLEVPGGVLETPDFLDVGSLLENGDVVAAAIPGRGDEVSIVGGAVRLACGFQRTEAAIGMHSAEWGDK